MSFTREPIGTRHTQFDPLQAVALADRLDTSDLERQHLQQSIYANAGAEASNRRTLAHNALVRDTATALGITPDEADKHITRLPQYQDLITQYETAFQPHTERVFTGPFGFGQKDVTIPPTGVTQSLRERTAAGANELYPSLFQSTEEQAKVAGGGVPLGETATGRAYMEANAERARRGEAPLSPREFTAGLEEGRKIAAETQLEKVRPYALRSAEASTKEAESKTRVQEASEPAQKLIAQATVNLHEAQTEHAKAESERARTATRVERYKLGEEKLPPNSPLARETALREQEHTAVMQYHKIQTAEAQLRLDHAREVDAAMKRGDIQGALRAAGIGGLEAQLRMDELKSVHVRQTLDDLLKAKTNLATEKDAGKASAYASQTNHLALDIAKATGAATMEIEVARPGSGFFGGMEKFSASEVPTVVGESYLNGTIAPRSTDSIEDVGRKGAWLTYINYANEFKHANDGSISSAKLHRMIEDLHLTPQQSEQVFKTLIGNPFVQRKIQAVK